MHSGPGKNKGLSLVETLVSLVLLSAMVISILGAFFISKMTAVRAKHKIAAMDIIRKHIEQELMFGYDGGNGGEGDYFATVTSGSPVAVTIDNRGTVSTADDLIGTITPDPYYPLNIEDAVGDQLLYDSVPYKVIGFVVNWAEDLSGGSCSERGLTYVSYHPS